VHLESHETAAPRNFRLCPHCGQPTPSQLPECVNCGARSLPEMIVADQARAQERFVRAYFARGAPLTYAILLFNLIVYVFIALVAGGNVMENLIYSVDAATLVAFGAKTNALLNQGEWFRLVTPIFIHIGLIHLASNSYVLWIIGPQVERLYGSARFMLLYLLTGIGGVFGSYLGHLSLRDSSVPSAGASGAIFGLFGVVAVFGYKYRRELPPAFRRAFGAGVFPVIAINLIIGFTVPFIDNSAHVGGLVTGAALALMVPYIAPGRERVSRLGLAILTVCLAVVACSFARAYQQSGAHLAERGNARARTASRISTFTVRNYVDKMNRANAVMVEALNALAPDAPPETRQQVFPRLARAADELEAAPAPDERAESVRHQLLLLMRKQQSLLKARAPAVTRESLRADADAFNQVYEQFLEWGRTEGAKHGYRVQPKGQ
jgi:rhomboid protease GluP